MWSQLFLHNIILQNNIWIFTPDISYQMCAATLSRCLSDTHFLCLRFCANSSGFECQVDKMRPPCKGHSVSPLHNNQNATKPLQSQPLALFITTTIMQTDCNCLLMSLLCTYPVSTSPDVAVRRIFFVVQWIWEHDCFPVEQKMLQEGRQWDGWKNRRTYRQMDK